MRISFQDPVATINHDQGLIMHKCDDPVIEMVTKKRHPKRRMSALDAVIKCINCGTEILTLSYY